MQFDLVKNPKTGEFVLDFFLTGDTPDGDGVVEWNGYRYAIYKKDGRKGVALFGMSRRAYGKDREAFFRDLKKDRATNLNALAGVKFPEVKLKPGALGEPEAPAEQPAAAFAALGLAAFVPAGLAAPAARAADCGAAATQSALTACAAAQYSRADDALNRTYNLIADRLKDDPSTKQALLAAQRAWIAFRDAHCAFAGARAAAWSR